MSLCFNALGTKEKNRDISSHIHAKTLKNNDVYQEMQDYYKYFFIVIRRRNLIISVGWRAEGEAFVKILPFCYLGRRELDESDKRLICIPNILRQTLPVSKKTSSKELEKKILKQEDRVWRRKSILVSM